MRASTKKTSSTQPAINSGFTLIELLVTIVVLGVIGSIAAPNISTQLANQRVKSTTATLISALKEAKVESAIRRRIMEVSYKNNDTDAGTIEIKTDIPELAPHSGSALYFSSVMAMGSIPVPDPDDSSNTGSGGTGSGGTGSGNTGSGNTGSGGTGNTIPAPIPTPDLGVIAAYGYDAKSVINATSATVTFEASKRVTPAVTYTICDTNTSALPRQVTVSTLGLIESQTGGTCQ